MEFQFKDYYKTMGLDKNASDDQIKRAYRKLARQYHPDVNKDAGAEAKFKEINEAYGVLKDPEKRKAYDQMGSHYGSGQQFNPNDFDFSQFKDFQGFQGFHQSGDHGEDFSNLGDLFENLFGGGGRHHHQKKRSRSVNGENLYFTVPLNVHDAYTGIVKTLQLEIPEQLSNGDVRYVPKTLKVKIPAGVAHEQQIRVSGQGQPGMNGGAPGDLYIKVELLPHSLFRVENKDVYLTVPLAPWEAALGAQIEVPTLAGNVTVKIPAGAKSGQKLRLKDKGFKSKKEIGSQFLELQIQTPIAETEEQKKCYESMQSTFNFNPRELWKGA